MKRTTRIVAFAALLAAAVLPAYPLAAADRRNGDGGTPQQGVPGTEQSGPVSAQANYQADYHADYRPKGMGESDAKREEPRADSQRDRRNPLPMDRLGRTPNAWPR